MGLRIDIVTIFPEYFGSPLGVSLIGKAVARGDIEFRVHDLRRWAADVHHTVDDVPFGGGPGMVMKPDVWGDALDEIVPRHGGSGGIGPPGTRTRGVRGDRSPRDGRSQPGPGRRGGRAGPPGRADAEREAVLAGHSGQVRHRIAAGLRLRALRGHRRPGRRRHADPDAGGRGEHRRLRAGGR